MKERIKHAIAVFAVYVVSVSLLIAGHELFVVGRWWGIILEGPGFYLMLMGIEELLA